MTMTGSEGDWLANRKRLREPYLNPTASSFPGMTETRASVSSIPSLPWMSLI
jgi:hypothetical protein